MCIHCYPEQLGRGGSLHLTPCYVIVRGRCTFLYGTITHIHPCAYMYTWMVHKHYYTTKRERDGLTA